jgi:hypothetical protein
VAFIDTHLFGTYDASSPDDGRYVARFSYSAPKETAAFKTHLAAKKRKETFDGVIYENTTHALTIYFQETTAAALATSVTEALNAIIPGQTWYFRAKGATTGYTATIIDVEHSETYKAKADGNTWTAIDFSITTLPGWQDTERAVTLSTAPTTLPGIITASGVLGSMPAPFRASLTFDQATTMQAIGIRHGLATGAVQDYQGVADTDALTGQSAQGTMDADGTALGTPATLDANVLRGWWLPVARVKQPDATPGDTTYKAVSTVSGSGTGTSQSYTTGTVPATKAGLFEKLVLPPVPIPAGAVPDVTTGSGWTAESIQVQNAVEDGTSGLLLSSEYLDTSWQIDVRQTFPTFTGHITAVQYRVRTAPSQPIELARLVVDDGTASVVHDLLASDVTVGLHTITLPSPFNTTAGSTGGLRLRIYADAPFTIGLAYSNGDYAGGALTTLIGSGESAGDDLTFAVYGQTQLGFNQTVGITAINAGAGTAKVDTVALVPYDEWSCVTNFSLAANAGVMYDAMEDLTVYQTSTTGAVGPLDQASSDPQGTPVIWPGTSAIVVDGDTGNAVPLGCDLTLTYPPTYKTPYGG